MRRYTNILTFISFLGLIQLGCTEENDFEKVVLPHTDIVGEYVVDLNLTQPFEFHDQQTIIISNTAASNDSLWVEDANFFESKVRVKLNGNKFSVTEGHDIIHGEVVNITGEVFPEKDSVSVEWRYLQMTGDPADDYVVQAGGVLFNGLTN